LAPSERRRLVLTMLEDVLALLGEIPGIDRILVVTPDPEVAAAAANHNAGVVSEDGPSDLNAAVRRCADDSLPARTIGQNRLRQRSVKASD
jgi:2-phospho-L-lactate guanylyltransferase (CobY/MobA/RfbA family)